ncbi:MAG: STAS/SEC14 domain-containing protein [Candidatus Paceibacterota bacterium]
MSFEIEEIADGKVIEVAISGKLTQEAYDAFVPLTEQRIKQFGKVRMLVIMHDFHGWDAGALWEDIKFDIRHFRNIERLAMVGEKKWEKGMTIFCRPFTTAKIQYFDLADLEAARHWIISDE